MNILSIEVENFASYKHLKFEMIDKGLILIQGPTGSGKSTLCDIIPWVLFGRTSKNGAVDDIRAWGNDNTTYGTITLGTGLTIVRTRAPNDLFYFKSSSDRENTRGKDLADTQRLINEILGMDAELYLAGAYYHEFSQTAQFFTTSAKNRRALCEQIVDLAIPKKIQESLTQDKRTVKENIAKMTNSIHNLEGIVKTLKSNQKSYSFKLKTYKDDVDSELAQIGKTISPLLLKLKPFDHYLEEKYAYIEAIKIAQTTKCKECGAPSDHEKIEELKKQLSTITSAELESDQISRQVGRLEEQADRLLQQKNPYTELIEQNEYELVSKEDRLSRALDELESSKLMLADCSVLSDIIEEYRGLKIYKSIQSLEATTNKYLSEYFDSEIRASFEVEGADKLEVTLYKDGNACVYTQLSKGQRCLLKLCFGVAVMASVANRHGLDIKQIFCDEALDGLDASMKLKAFKLLQNLPYSTIFIVEHHAPTEIEFSAKYEVTLTNEGSQLEKN